MKIKAVLEIDFDKQEGFAKINIEELFCERSFDKYWFNLPFSDDPCNIFKRFIVMGLLDNARSIFEIYKKINNPPKTS